MLPSTCSTPDNTNDKDGHMTNIKLTDPQGTEIEVNDMIAGHLLWEAMSEFRDAYRELTNLCHALSTESGGPSSAEVFRGAAHRVDDLGAGKALLMETWALRAKAALAKMQHAVAQANTMSHGEVYDDLIDPALLGPDTRSSGLRKVYTENATGSGPTTHVYEKLSGLQIYFGLNRFDGDNGPVEQPFVAIPCDDLPSRFEGEGGEPILCVNVGDVDVYDNEGSGDKTNAVSMSEAEMLTRLKRALDGVEGKGDQGAWDVTNEVRELLIKAGMIEES
jgi:hypothetical protein